MTDDPEPLRVTPPPVTPPATKPQPPLRVKPPAPDPAQTPQGKQVERETMRPVQSTRDKRIIADLFTALGHVRIKRK